MRRYIRAILSSISVYAASSVYGFGVLAMLLIATGEIMLIFGIFALGIFAIIVALVALSRELASVHELVNGNHDAMVERIDQLVAKLQANDVPIPRDKNSKEGSRNG